MFTILQIISQREKKKKQEKITKNKNELNAVYLEAMKRIGGVTTIHRRSISHVRPANGDVKASKLYLLIGFLIITAW